MIEDRRQHLAQRLVQEGKLVIKELTEEFGVSSETIRKDISYLERLGIAKRTHGGAIYVNDEREVPFFHSSTLNRPIKSLIAQKAITFINGRVIMFDGGSTTLAIARLLSLEENLIVFTNSLSAVPILANAPGIELILTGGMVRNVAQDQVGFWTSRTIQEVSADIAFIGTNSLTNPNGPSTSNMDEVAVKQAMIRAARTRYLVTDSTKLNIVSTYQFAQWNDFTGIITDRGITQDFYDHVSRFTEIIIAD
ncbi:MAG: DeoR/GlpR family DNA-binding transcription regulator [Sulfobacillus thermotolerans]|nr:DeoR/GlpR family DNA-binding transcription regulator [Sulfobacillus thermotolerans]